MPRVLSIVWLEFLLLLLLLLLLRSLADTLMRLRGAPAAAAAQSTCHQLASVLYRLGLAYLLQLQCLLRAAAAAAPAAVVQQLAHVLLLLLLLLLDLLLASWH
jgi:hypothetical protein